MQVAAMQVVEEAIEARMEWDERQATRPRAAHSLSEQDGDSRFTDVTPESW